jgi:hypothetical protein
MAGGGFDCGRSFANRRRRMKTISTAVVLATAFLAAPAGAASLPFIDDDYGRALAQAKESKKPLVIEVWAPW